MLRITNDVIASNTELAEVNRECLMGTAFAG
jgi:hypothetical protein